MSVELNMPSTRTASKEKAEEEGDEGRAGGCGLWQWMVYVVLGLIYMRGVWAVFASIFFNYDPGHRCATSDDVTWNTSLLPEGEAEWAQCKAYVNVSLSNDTHPCPLGLEFQNDGSASSIVTEWGLACGVGAWQAELATTLYMVGSVLGTPLTPIADRLGRRPFLLACLGLQAALGLGLYWAPGIVTFTVLRFFVGLTNMAIALSTYILVAESVPRRLRTIPAVGMSILWAAGIMLLALLGFLLQPWRHLQLALALFNLPCMLLLLLVPESIPWLLSRRRTHQAEKIARRILKVNGLDLTRANMAALAASLGGDLKRDVTEKQGTCLSYERDTHVSASPVDGKINLGFSEGDPTVSENGTSKTDSNHPSRAVERKDFEEKVHDKTSGEMTSARRPDASPKELLTHPRMRLYTFVIFFLYLANSLSYFGISLGTPLLHGNRFLNLMLSGAVEVPAYLICGYLVHRVGRRRPMSAFMAICAVMNIATIFVPETTAEGQSLGWLKTTLVMIGKFGVAGSYSTLYLLGAEIFPTAIRNQAVGYASFFENVGVVASPLIVFAAKTLRLVPLVAYAVVTGVGAGLILLLPETNRRPLPSTVAEVASWDKVGPKVKAKGDVTKKFSSVPSSTDQGERDYEYITHF